MHVGVLDLKDAESGDVLAKIKDKSVRGRGVCEDWGCCPCTLLLLPLAALHCVVACPACQPASPPVTMPSTNHHLHLHSQQHWTSVPGT